MRDYAARAKASYQCLAVSLAVAALFGAVLILFSLWQG